MQRKIVLQRGICRVSFIYDDSKPEDTQFCTNGRRTLVLEQHGYVGSSLSYRQVTKEQGNDYYKLLIEEGYHRFRSLNEVSWYATIENNTPYEEEWTTDGIYFIPVRSHSIR